LEEDSKFHEILGIF